MGEARRRGAFRRDGGSGGLRAGQWKGASARFGTASAERRAGAPCVAYGALRMPRGRRPRVVAVPCAVCQRTAHLAWHSDPPLVRTQSVRCRRYITTKLLLLLL